MDEGVRAIFGEGIDQLTGNQAGILGGDTEALHQMRVAIRRLRSALTLLAPYLEPETARGFADRLRTFGRVLGPARDWDVFLLETLPRAMANSTEPGWLARLAAPAEIARHSADDAAQRLIASQEFQNFAASFVLWGADGNWAPPRRNDLPAEALADHAPAMLGRLADTARRRGRHLGERSMPELHALRKTLKKLRYGTDYLAGLFAAEPVGHYRRSCKLVLGVLGRINDTVTTDCIAGALLQDPRSPLAPAVSLLFRHCADDRADALRALPEAWAKFRAAEPFWR